ncbi:MAG: hypothetical protein R3D98_05165 [Candidatus Krumholzibacteriia bacterium]
MLFETYQRDERTRAQAGQAAGLWLGATQILLMGVIVYRLYVLGQPDEQLRDFQVVMGVSLFGNILTQLFLGGLLPVPTWKGMIVAYVILSGAIVGVCLAVYGVPAVTDWPRTWLPTLAGPAILLAVYRLVAWLGKRRIDRLIAAE